MRGATSARLQDYPHAFISIHAPHAGRDLSARYAWGRILSFQSTRPMRGATDQLGVLPEVETFQSTRPMRGATFAAQSFKLRSRISIHAPHAGRDRSCFPALCQGRNFNPRAPCGARQQKYTKLLYTLLRQKAILRQFHAKRCLSKRFAACRSAKTSLFAVRTAAEISASFCFAL